MGVVLITDQSPLPGWWALAPLAGARLLIPAGSATWPNRKLFGNPMAVQLGLVSYPFYLWHRPLRSFAYIVHGERPPRSMIEGSRLGRMRARTNPQPFDAAAFLRNNRVAHARLLEIARRSGATVIDPVASLCPQDRCAVVDASGEPVDTDSVHMRPKHSLQAAAYLAPALASALAPALEPIRRARRRFSCAPMHS